MKLVILSPKNLLHPVGGDVALTQFIYGQEKFSKLFSSIERVMLVKAEEAGNQSGYFGIPKKKVTWSKLISKFLLGYTHPIFTRFNDPDIAKVLGNLRPDVVVAEHLYMVPNQKSFASMKENCLVIASVHVIESKIQRGLKRILSNSLKYSEIKALNSVDIAITFNSKEKMWIEKNAPEVKTILIKPFMPGKSQTNLSGNFLFVGNQTWTPNRECVEEIHKAWRVLNARGIDLKIDVLGIPPKIPYKNIPNGVKHHGFVEDLTPLYQNAKCLIAPIRTGGGVRVKLLEAGSYGIPIVISESGLDDLVELREYVNIANDTDTVISQILFLSSDLDRLQHQSNNIYTAILNLYDKSNEQWDNLIKMIEGYKVV